MKSGAYLELRVEGMKSPPRSVVTATRPFGWLARRGRLVYPLSGEEFEAGDSHSVRRTLEAVNRASYVMKILGMHYRISLQGRSRTSRF